MTSKQICIASLIYGAQALNMLASTTYDSAKKDSSTSAGYGCHQCLRYGFIYVTPTSQAWWSRISSGGNYLG